jgi:hypothetical protein
VGIPEQPKRFKLVGWLAGVVVLVGVGSLLVNGRFGTRDAPPTPRDSPTSTAVPTPPYCGVDELSVVGAFDVCAAAAPDAASICTLSNEMLDDLLRFAGGNQVFGLHIEVDGGFSSAGKYDLPPWPHGLGTRDGVAKVEIDEYSTDTLWQSIAGVLTITTADGRTGIMDGTFQAKNGISAVPGVPPPTLRVSGQWVCPESAT